MSSPPQEGAAPPAKSRRKGVALVGAALALLLAGAGVVLFTGEEAPAAEVEAAPEPEATTVISLQPFVLNLADEDGDRYLRLNLALLVTCEKGTPKGIEEGPEHAHLRDRVLVVLGAKRTDELVSFEGKEALRLELARELTALLDEERVVDVLFTEFLIQ